MRPYLGIGVGHAPHATRGWGMFFDAAVAYGRPHLDYDVPAAIVAEAGQANVNAPTPDHGAVIVIEVIVHHAS